MHEAQWECDGQAANVTSWQRDETCGIMAFSPSSGIFFCFWVAATLSVSAVRLTACDKANNVRCAQEKQRPRTPNTTTVPVAREHRGYSTCMQRQTVGQFTVHSSRPTVHGQPSTQATAHRPPPTPHYGGRLGTGDQGTPSQAPWPFCPALALVRRCVVALRFPLQFPLPTAPRAAMTSPLLVGPSLVPLPFIPTPQSPTVLLYPWPVSACTLRAQCASQARPMSNKGVTPQASNLKHGHLRPVCLIAPLPAYYPLLPFTPIVSTPTPLGCWFPFRPSHGHCQSIPTAYAERRRSRPPQRPQAPSSYIRRTYGSLLQHKMNCQRPPPTTHVVVIYRSLYVCNEGLPSAGGINGT